ncbi:MAG: restriction endonuclease subunit S [Proteobacteria bacterium]|nr:type I restriction endonuclease subunit S [Desulfocapsa sp.]MBU3943664.1 restriction endonuclease subunit S [Pseudomonadota bacterium]MCG2742331.1 restriction endonuclease subunit S [Desulfobacteraceae bacterium]MBU4029922.1 restriction endonuclease subunit S [Pseudomonadota bacterium]MBU4042256.1 restriction endonuclease subunit S [Pseudomonadota bacterium]
MSFPRYERYKESGVEWLGEVPGHWDVKRIGYYFNERREKVSDKDYPALSVTKNGIVPQLDTAAKTDDGDNRKKVCKGDFVINSRSDRKGSSGVSDRDGSVSLICTVIRPQEQVYTPFVHHLLRCQPFQEEFYRNGKGIVADLWSTNYSEMRNIHLGMPPISEQQAIAVFLDRETAKIDALIAEQQRLIALLAEKRQATISHAVTKGLNPDAPMKDSGVEWLGVMPEHWVTPTLNSRYSIELGKMLDEKRITGTHLVPYLRNIDVQWDSINYEELPEMDIQEVEFPRYTVQKGDLLICEGGEVGRAAMVADLVGICGFQKALHRVRPRDASEHTRFLFYTFVWAAATGVFKVGGTSTIAHLTGEQLRRYRFPKPTYVEQTAIAAFLDIYTTSLDTLTTEAQRAITLLQERRSALISAAVTGKINLQGVA